MIYTDELLRTLDTQDMWNEVYQYLKLEHRENHNLEKLWNEVKRRLQFAEDNGVTEV